MSTKHVGIFRSEFGSPSEAWLVAQVGMLVRHSPMVLTRTRHGATELPTRAVADQLGGSWRGRLFSLTRWPRLVGRRTSLAHLRLIHAHFGPDGLLILPLARRLGVPLLVSFHGFDAMMTQRALLASRGVSNLRFLLGEGQLKKEATAILAVSSFVADRLREKGYPEHKIVVHHIGVDTAKILPRPRSRRDDRFILCVGRHVAVKGLDTLLRAFSRVAVKHPDVGLEQVGAGPMTPVLRALVDQLGLGGRVHFRGALAHAETLALMQGAELFVLPSQKAANGQSEALGIVFNEASACAVPIVSTRNGGIPEAVIDGSTGMLVEERDEVALAERMDLLLADRGQAAEMGRRGREFVCERFDLRKQTKLLEDLYERLVG